MTAKFQTRNSLPEDVRAIEALYADAFEEEDLVALVRQLLSSGADVFSLVGTAGDVVVAHAAFTRGRVPGNDADVALLGPLAVAPHWQRNGLGRLIVRYGLDQLKDEGIGHVFVLGDPAYYGRIGFKPELQVAPLYPLPEEWDGAWQSITLGDAGALAGGKIELPELWRREALWSP